MGWLSYKKWVSSSEKYLVSDCFAYEQKLSHRGSCMFSVDQCIVYISSWVDAPHLLSMWVAWLQSIVGIKPTLLPRAKLLGTPLASFIGKHALRNQHISPQWTDIFSCLPRYRVLTISLKYVPPLFSLHAQSAVTGLVCERYTTCVLNSLRSSCTCTCIWENSAPLDRLR